MAIITKIEAPKATTKIRPRRKKNLTGSQHQPTLDEVLSKVQEQIDARKKAPRRHL